MHNSEVEDLPIMRLTMSGTLIRSLNCPTSPALTWKRRLGHDTVLVNDARIPSCNRAGSNCGLDITMMVCGGLSKNLEFMFGDKPADSI